MLNACLDKRLFSLFPPAPIWSTILLLLSANAVAGAPLHANDDGSSSVMNSMQTAPLLISTVLRKENADAVQCEPPAVSASKGHCMCPQGTACSGSEQCRGGVSVTTKQHVSGYLQNCAGCTCTALGKGGGGGGHRQGAPATTPAPAAVPPAATASPEATSPRVLIMTVATHR